MIQKRQEGLLDFDRVYSEYKAGFGSPDGDYWLGLENIRSLLFADQGYRYREVRLEGNDLANYVQYNKFSVSDVHDGYRLYVDELSGGTVGKITMGDFENSKSKDKPVPNNANNNDDRK